MQSPDDDGTAQPIINVPATVAELAPPEDIDLSVMMRQFARGEEAWGVAHEHLGAMGGVGARITGDPLGDEWYMTKQLQALADKQGLDKLATLEPNVFRKKLRFAVRSLGKFAVHQLIAQGKRLRLEDKRDHKEAAE